MSQPRASPEMGSKMMIQSKDSVIYFTVTEESASVTSIAVAAKTPSRPNPTAAIIPPMYPRADPPLVISSTRLVGLRMTNPPTTRNRRPRMDLTVSFSWNKMRAATVPTTAARSAIAAAKEAPTPPVAIDVPRTAIGPPKIAPMKIHLLIFLCTRVFTVSLAFPIPTVQNRRMTTRNTMAWNAATIIDDAMKSYELAKVGSSQTIPSGT